MPKVSVNGVEVYYEVHGSGEPVLLVEGLGYATWQWFRQIEEFAASYLTVIFDNRGVGESDKPDTPYSIDLLADDAAGLLKALGLTRVHVLGTSMGGFVAQKLALRHPELVRSLVLAGTSFGGPHSLPMTEEALASMHQVTGLTPEEAIRWGFEIALSPKFRAQEPEIMTQLVRWRLVKPTPRFAWARQFQAGVDFNAEGDLAQIQVPTLVLTGLEDIVLPPQNSSLLAKSIPGAQLITLPGGHLFFIENAAEFNRHVLDFWQRVAQVR
ncbi:alpha/beta fold hydrolase [Paradesulfitobacterium ferrireducens]|uniref:alpha/beta fold hydrolase n=1 Tax=Paradesulfitobacterium ferrireducens TaxID=2816476 RepID=UPI001A8EEB18|nr:alpha/beta fold hydrolase [Paradesulfitobacterium ferrireducens]